MLRSLATRRDTRLAHARSPMLWSLATRRDTRLAHARSAMLWSLATRRDTRLAHARSPLTKGRGRRRIAFVALGLVALAVPLGACNNDAPSASGGSGSGSSSGSGQKDLLIYTEQDTDITVANGHVFVVELPITAGTGYTWVAESNPKLQQMESQQLDVTRPGASTVQRITFRAQGTGTTMLVLNYVRPWENGVAPAETTSFDVTIAS